jgi:uncharacterized integral membrane protein
MATDPHAPQASATPHEPGQPAQPESDSTPARAVDVPLPKHKIRRTRIGGVWIAVASFAVVLLLLLIFILQNSRSVEVSYFGAHGHLPLGVALLLAAVCGVLLIVLPGTARIIQLRATARRHDRADQRHRALASPGTATGADSDSSDAHAG